MKIEDIAKVCHEVNKIYSKIIGDINTLPWDHMNNEMKYSVISGVEFVQDYVGKVTPQIIHDNWWRHKRNDGWVYGEEKDQYKKTHPCMVPFEDLSEEVKNKDIIFITVVESLIPFLGVERNDYRI